jgi:UDP-N-acetylglucosamine 4-epimerase
MQDYKYHTIDISKFNILVTGGAGFIGSHIAEYFVKHGIGKLTIVDNLSTGSFTNISHLIDLPNVNFIEGDITDIDFCNNVMQGIDFVSHQAALGSVPRSINDPSTSVSVNVFGFVNVLNAAVKANVKRLVYASSSSVYGDHPALPKIEQFTGNLLSPYAATKSANELFADVFNRVYKLPLVGIRYFNVFGERQNPNGPYAAVIPLFINAFLGKNELIIHGDGEQTRDFTYVQNVVQANVKSLFSNIIDHTVFNIACGESISLQQIVNRLEKISSISCNIRYTPERGGDIKNSLADFSKAKNLINYDPIIKFDEGLVKTFFWFKNQQS